MSAFPALSVRWEQGTSGGEVLAQALGPDAAVFKAFNTVGVEHMKDPTGAASGSDHREDMLIAGDVREEFRAILLTQPSDLYCF